MKSTRPAVSCDMATEVEVVKMWKSLSMESLLHCLLLAAVGEGFLGGLLNFQVTISDVRGCYCS